MNERPTVISHEEAVLGQLFFFTGATMAGLEVAKREENPLQFAIEAVNSGDIATAAEFLYAANLKTEEELIILGMFAQRIANFYKRGSYEPTLIEHAEKIFKAASNITLLREPDYYSPDSII